MKTVRLRIAKDSVRPRVFKKMVRDADADTPNGSYVEVVDRDGAFVGRGLWNRRSTIPVRLLTRDPAARLDDDFLRRRVLDAVRLRRERLRLDEITDAYRLIHGEGDGVPGLVVDRFGGVLSAEVSLLAIYERMAAIKEWLREAVGFEALVVREESRYAKIEGFRIPPPRPSADWRTTVREHGARFRVDAAGAHKTGWFCDQRETRQALAALARGRRVADLCCHAGGFAIHALRAGARSATLVDLDEVAAASARANLEENGLAAEVIHADAFAFLRETPAGRFDAIVLDPPKFVRGIDERGGGLRRYADLNRLALERLDPGGLLLTCSCSGLVDEATFLDVVRRAAVDAGRRLRVLRLGGAPPDHPVDPEIPETRYLKTILAEALT